MGVASLILGIIALMIAIFGGPAGFVGSICGVLAIVLGVIGKKNPESKSAANAGFVCGVIALLWGIIVTVACVACIGAGAALGSADGL